MPLKLNVGLSKKIGLPRFGSLGASCHLEFELPVHQLERDPTGFHSQIAETFAACRQAVEEELARHAVVSVHDPPPPANGHTSHSATGGSTTDTPLRRPATPSQVRAIHAIIRRQELDLAGTLAPYQAQSPEELSVVDAGRLIGRLNRAAQTPGGAA
jgi:hypothetical protein